PGAAYNRLFAVAAISPNNVWAAGDSAAGFGLGYDTLIVHWDGSSWTVVSSPNPPGAGPHDDHLHDVAALSANDIWAVGSFLYDEFGGYHTLIEHWNGSSWSVAPSPNISEYRNALYGVV